jgi:uncharacterized protein with NRDE domain
MCTLIAFYRVIRGYPIVVGMNRDEMLSRKAREPQPIEGVPRVYAPGDQEAGGTWLGMNEWGLFAAILNRVSTRPSDAPPSPRSRGLLCLDALKKPGAEEAMSFVRAETAQPRYNKFTFLCLDKRHAYRVHFDNSRQVEVAELGPGLHVLVNYELKDSADTEYQRQSLERSERRRERALEFLHGSSPRTPEEAMEKLKGIFKDHEKDMCQHRGSFGTVSSSLVAIGVSGPEAFWYARGSPCTSPYQDFSHIFAL